MPDYLFKKITKYCETCGSQLILNNTRDIQRKRFCSRSCLSRYLHTNGFIPPIVWKNRPTKVKKFCKVCRKEIYYRSVNCLCKTCFNKQKRNKIYNQRSFRFNKGKNLQTFLCAECEKEFQGYKSQYLAKETFCSRKCKSIYHGRKSRTICHFYKDGRTPLRFLIKNSGRMDEWRNQIYQRDDYKCVWCDHNGNDLHAHHLVSFSKLLTAFLERYKQFNPESDKNKLLELAWGFSPFWDIGNGITLCKDCHFGEHGLLKKGENIAGEG